MKIKKYGVKFKIKHIYEKEWGITVVSVNCKQLSSPELTYYFGTPSKENTKFFAEDLITTHFKRNEIDTKVGSNVWNI